MGIARLLKLASAPLALTVVLALAVAACKTPDLEGPVVSRPALATPTATVEAEIPESPGPTVEPEAPGISDEAIKIGVIADASAGNAVTGGSESAWLAMRAWAQAVNSTGGLGGRDVEIVLFDSNVFDHRAAIQEACDSDIFALVGSYALFDGDGVDLLNDESCRLPDFPAAALSPARRESPVTFVSNPTSNDLWQAGAARFLSERYPQSSAALGTVILDLPVAFYRAQRDIEAATAGGFGFAFQTTADVVGEDYDALASALLEEGARGIFWSADSQRLLELLRAWERLMAQLPTLALEAPAEEEPAGTVEGDAAIAPEEESTPVPEGGTDPETEDAPVEPAEDDAVVEDEPTGGEFFVLCSTDCYSQSWVEQAGELETNIWVSIGMLPFEEPGDNVELVRYVLFLREEVDEEAEVDLIGLSSWASALLFEEAVNRAMFTSGGGLTRELVIEAAGTITEWDGRGLHGPTNPAEGIPSTCFMLVSPTPSGWIRRHPTTQGTLDCDPDNLVELVESATLGIDPSRRDSANSS
ncbi:MAG: ABC transporter substrate-binding protein [bacterium]|nr:ABC transporter substrate-binding protein [bacterium]